MARTRRESSSSLSLVLQRHQDAIKAAGREQLLAMLSSIAHYFCAIAGAAGGAIAAATVAAGGVSNWIPIVAGALAAVGAGLPPVFHFEERAVHHTRSKVRFDAVADFAENGYARVQGTSTSDVQVTLNEVQERLDEARDLSAYSHMRSHP